MLAAGRLATYQSYLGRRCARHAEALRAALMDPRTLGNILARGVLDEEQVKRLVVELPS